MSALYLITSVLYIITVHEATSQGMPGMGMPGMSNQQHRAKPYKKYFPRIQCQVCETMIKQIVRETKFKYRDNPGITEGELFNATEATCHPFKDEGIWITQYDIVKEAPKLKLKLMTTDKDEIGECDRECETIAYSCMEILDENNIEITEYLWNHLGKLKRSELSNDICRSYCRKEKSDVKKNSKMGKEAWYPLFDVEKRQMIQLADAMPPGVQMYDPSMMSMDDMMEQMQAMYGDEMPEFDDEGNLVEKKKKKKSKKDKKAKTKETDSPSVVDKIYDGVNHGINTVKGWLAPFWGDDGRGDQLYGEL